MSNQEHVDVNRPDYEHMAWFERASVLHDEYRFVPTSKGEINRAFSGVIAFEHRPGSVGEHLNETLRHQIKHGSQQPEKAVQSIVREMSQYYRDAFERRLGLLSVYKALKADVNPELSILLIDDLDPVGVLSTVQHFRIVEGIRDHNSEALKGGIKSVGVVKRLVTNFDIQTHDRTSIEMAIEQLPKTTQHVAQFRDTTLSAGLSQRNRKYFWQNALLNSKSHSIALPLVDDIINSVTK